MTLDEYQQEALKTLQPSADLAYCLTKLIIESAEAAQPAVKEKYHGKPIDVEYVADELGDSLYYLSVSADKIGWTLEQIAQHNIKKLRTRHGVTYNPAFYKKLE